jgi:hypothetical protein
MAMLYIGQNAGQFTEDPEIPVAGSSTQSTDVELRIDLTKSWTSVELRKAVDNIVNALNFSSLIRVQIPWV